MPDMTRTIWFDRHDPVDAVPNIFSAHKSHRVTTFQSGADTICIKAAKPSRRDPRFGFFNHEIALRQRLKRLRGGKTCLLYTSDAADE